MKRLILVILTSLVLFIGFDLKAQSFSDLLTQSEQIKAKYGETDDRYLDALSKAIQAAFREEKDEDANKYRLEHAEIVKNRYGINSLEYAEDLWRLGNVSSFKGEAYTFDCYKKAEQIYTVNNAQNEYPYCDLMWKLYWHYFDAENYYLALSYLKRYTSLCEPWTQNEWKGNTLSMMAYANAYVVLGDLYRIQLNDQSSSKDAYLKGIEIIEKNNLITEYRYSSLPYAMLADFYSDEHNFKEALKWQSGYLNALEQKGLTLSDEYISAFAIKTLFLKELGEYETIDSDIQQLITAIENRDKELGVPVQFDSLYTDAKKELISNCISFNDFDKVIPYAIDLLQTYETAGKEESVDYWRVLGSLIYAYHRISRVNDEYLLFGQYEDLSQTLGLNNSDEYKSYLGLKAEALSLLNKNEEYDETINELSSHITTLNGPHSIERLTQEYLNAGYQEGRGNHIEAIKGVERCYDIINSPDFSFNSQKDSLTMLFSLHHLEGYAYTTIDPSLAERIIKQAIIDGERIDGINLSATYLNLGHLYHNWKRDSRLALSYYKKAKQISEEAGDNYSINYISILNNIGLCYLQQGQSGLAIAVFDIAGNVVEKEYGKQHSLYGITSQNKSLFYSEISDHLNALKWGEEALSCIKYNYGENSSEYATALQNQGANYQHLEDYEKAKDCILKSIEINEKANNPNSVYGYISLLYLYYQENNDEKVLDCAKKGLDLIDSNNWQETDIAAAFYGTWGYLLRLRMNPTCKDALWKAIDIYNKIGSYDTPRFCATILNLAAASFIDNSQSDKIIPLIVDSYRDMYLNNTAFYNSNERETFLLGNTFSETKNVLFSSRIDGSEDTKLLEFLLFNKGLLLGTAVNYAKAVFNSGDDDLISAYQTLLSLNKFIAGEPTEIDGNPSKEEALNRATEYEREITLYLRQHYNYTDNLAISFDDLKSSMDANTLAVEFVNYVDYSDNTEYYSAMITKKDSGTPVYIKLCSKSDLEKYMSLSPERIYSESPASQELYEKIWAPIVAYAQGISKIVFSPAGYLNKLAIEYVFWGDKRFEEVYEVTRVTSTRELCNKVHPYRYDSAVLYGGLEYDEDEATMIKESRNVRGDLAIEVDRFRGYTYLNTRSGWDYLPGSLSEVQEISSIITRGHIENNVFSGEKGNEESFKALSGRKFEILHIATHGFFMTDSQAARSDFFTNNPYSGQSQENGISPLYRTGLILSGGNKAWKGETIPDNVEDGVLTAAEISNLNLASCDIVVLSACETGLGEITDEGVFGLQRAFKNAGVNTIIMSLWEVDDQATSLMMWNFYNNLVKGKSKRESFNAAQKEVRKKYSDPRYWAAFIMLD